ncbi:MAG TPA: STAS domain-containing protein [Solirubrobacteraceae bacterium]|jgi:anti-anti-sigma factor|nr:STAS domain-containing protein [Solirubrobacteraceae bacterium]
MTDGSPRDCSDRTVLACEVEPEREVVRVRPAGELDMATVRVLEGQIQQLRRAGFRRMIVDLSKLEFMDAAGLRLILALDAEARQDGFSIAFVPGPPSVMRVFEVTRTAGRINFTEP